MPFYNRPAQIDVTGDIEVLGPSLADINGGMGGVYVRTTGKEGKGSIRITLPENGQSVSTDFTITKNV